MVANASTKIPRSFGSIDQAAVVAQVMKQKTYRADYVSQNNAFLTRAI